MGRLVWVFAMTLGALPAAAQEPSGATETKAEGFDVGIGRALDEQKAAEAQASSSILTSASTEKIWDLGYLTLSDYLASVPGLDSIQSHWYSWPSARGLRGSINFMIDGVSYTSPIDNRYPGGYGLFLEEFDRIDVTTGPAGVQWGAHSMLGVVNALTGKQSEESTAMRTAYGARDFQRLSVRQDRALGDGHLRLFLGYSGMRKPSMRPGFRFDGMPPYAAPSWALVANDKRTVPDQDLYLTASARYAGEHWVAYLRLPYAKEHSQVSELGGILDPGKSGGRDNLDALGYLSYERAFLNGQLPLLARLTWYSIAERLDRRLFPESELTPYGARSLQEIWVSRFALTWELKHRVQRAWMSSDLSFGADSSALTPHSSRFSEVVPTLGGDLFEQGDVVQARPLTDSPADLSIYAFEEMRLWDRVSLAGGARYNLSNSYQRQALFQANAGVRGYGRSYLKVGITQGMRPPTLLDREGLQPVLGRRDLPVEQSRAVQFEATTAWSLPKWTSGMLRADYARTRTTNITREGQRVEPYRFEPVPTVGHEIESLEGVFDADFLDHKANLHIMYYGNIVREPAPEPKEGEPVPSLDERIRTELDHFSTTAQGGTYDEKRVRPNYGPRHRWQVSASASVLAYARLFATARGHCGGVRRLFDSWSINQLQTKDSELGCYAFYGGAVRFPAAPERIGITLSADNIFDQRYPSAFFPLQELNGGEAPLNALSGRTIFVLLEWHEVAG